jgi:hypothetical protein
MRLLLGKAKQYPFQQIGVRGESKCVPVPRDPQRFSEGSSLRLCKKSPLMESKQAIDGRSSVYLRKTFCCRKEFPDDPVPMLLTRAGHSTSVALPEHGHFTAIRKKIRDAIHERVAKKVDDLVAEPLHA